MSHADWRSADAYESLRSLDASGFAWEYLRRNSEFLRDQNKLERAARQSTLDPAEMEAFTRRWGVRFREPESDEKPWLCTMVCKCFAKRRRLDAPPSRSRRC
jgi:hypothetical protein